jgi:hypothetical protein
MNDKLLIRVLDRGEVMADKYGVGFNRMTSALDMVHADKQYPLDWAALLTADDVNFAHDFFGIRHHINRKTGLLEDCFVPRFARPAKETA